MKASEVFLIFFIPHRVVMAKGTPLGARMVCEYSHICLAPVSDVSDSMKWSWNWSLEYRHEWKDCASRAYCTGGTRAHPRCLHLSIGNGVRGANTYGEVTWSWGVECECEQIHSSSRVWETDTPSAAMAPVTGCKAWRVGMCGATTAPGAETGELLL